MIRYVKGNLFDSKAVALVNTVNCVGIMGKGVAYQFRRAYPKMFTAYVAQCRRGEVQLGAMTTHEEAGRIIINFPTKDHWRSPSRLEDVATGLQALKALLLERGIDSVALPPLGCGNGGLAWSEVKPLIEAALSGLPGVSVEVFEPLANFASKVAKEPHLSLGHFVLTGLRVGLASPNKLNIQKAAYFFNEMVGQNYFRFTKHKFGPYCPSIDPMLITIKDYLDYASLTPRDLMREAMFRKLPGTEADRLRAWEPALSRAVALCNRAGDQVEAAATVHAIVRERRVINLQDLIESFFAWSPEKRERFTAPDVERAVAFLMAEHLLAPSLFGMEAQALPQAIEAPQAARL